MTWERVTLKELGDWYGGGTPSKSNPAFWTDGDVPWLSPKDMGPEVLHGTQDHVTSEAVSGSSTKLVPAGSVAVVTRSGILERTIPVALVPFATTMNQDMKAVVPRTGIDPRWIAWGLRAFERDLLRDTRKAGTTVASIEMPRWYGFKLPVPPLEEQRRILAILEDQLSRLDAADKYLADGERHIQAWRATVIDEVLWRGNPPMRPIRELLREGMRNGRSDRAVKGQERGTRTLTLTAVTQNSFTDEFTKETVTPPSVADGLWLEPGDIFVQRANTPELVGTSARYEGDRKWAIFPDLLIRLRPDETRIRGEYLVAALRSERTHRQLRAKAKGLAGSMPKIDQRAVAETCVPCPELGSQIEAVIALNEIADAASALSRDVRAQRRRSAALRRSLLAAAFSGRLTGSSSEMSAVEGRIEA